MRRGRPKLVRLVSACTTTSSGLLPSSVAVTTEPMESPWRWDRKSCEGLSTSASPFSFISKMPTSLVEPKRFFTAPQQPVGAEGLALEVEDGIHDMLQHARPGDGAVLGDVAGDEDGGLGLLGPAHQPEGALAHLGDAAGRGIQLGQKNGLYGIHDGQAGLEPVEVLDDAVQVGLGQQR